MATNNLRKHVSFQKKFCKLKTTDELALLLETEKHKLTMFAQAPPYSTYEIPKPKGGTRLIEDPHEPLKEILGRLNYYLQCVYYFFKPACSYGFIINHRKEADKRNIITNAERHLGNTYMLNADMKDFFHLATYDKIYNVYKEAPFRFQDEVAHLLACLTTYNGRLPMGSPASPALSNFAAYAMDLEIQQFALRNGLTFTRFVDDMTFSTNIEQVSETQFVELNSIILSHRFVLNPAKTKWFGPADEKLITGLCLKNNRAEIPSAFFDQLQKDLTRLKSLYEVYYGIEKAGGNRMVDAFTENVEGRINFVQYVYGKKSGEYRKLEKQFAESTQPADEAEVMQWLDIPYDFIT